MKMMQIFNGFKHQNITADSKYVGAIFSGYSMNGSRLPSSAVPHLASIFQLPGVHYC